MTPVISESEASNLAATFRGSIMKFARAFSGGDIPAANDHMLSILRSGDALALEDGPGRSALEAMLDDDNPFVRLHAGSQCMAWAEEKAVPVLGRLLFEDLGSTSAAAERAHIRHSAMNTLLLHFGIRSWRQNDLIAPLRAHGVDLPYEEEEIWT
jgi:hypothetical protein